MPEKGWYSLTVRKKTSVRVRELAKNRGLTLDEFINELMRPSSKGVWSTCSVCGAKVKARNLTRHMARKIWKDICLEKAMEKRKANHTLKRVPLEKHKPNQLVTQLHKFAVNITVITQ